MSKYLISFLAVFLFCFHAVSETIEVGKGRKFSKIKDAVFFSKEGDTLLIYPGIYKEGEIIMTKRLFVIGINQPVLDGEFKTQVLSIHGQGTVLEGLTLQNAGINHLKENAGVRFEKATGSRIRNCRFINNFFAIYLSGSDSITIDNNVIAGNSESETSSGNGIHFWKSTNGIIKNNTISGQRDGIYLEFASGCLLEKNYSFQNLRYGLHFMFSDRNIYRNNRFANNGSGVAVMYTKNVIMEGNIFEDNWGSASYGLLLKDIGNVRITNNIFRKNTAGISMDGTNDIMLKNNHFISNGWALKIWGNCFDDTLYQNNFIGNTFDVSSNSNKNMNYYYSNYWDHYKGYDLNRDSKGDIPFYPMSFFSKVTEKYPFALLLLHSFFVDILNELERLLPGITPEEFRDDSPVMKPFDYDKNLRT